MNCNFCFFFQLLCPKSILFESFTWVIFHIDFVSFLFRISKLKNDISYIKYHFSHRLEKVCRWLNMYYSNTRIIFKKITTISIWIIFKKNVWTYKECNFYQYWDTQSYIHPHVSIWSSRGKVRNKNVNFSISIIGHCYVR